MNCKQGDLAIVVRSSASNEGAIVLCVRLLPAGAEGWSRLGQRWQIDRALAGCNGPVISVPDAWLRPLRDSEGEDEMLRLVGKPADSLVGA